MQRDEKRIKTETETDPLNPSDNLEPTNVKAAEEPKKQQWHFSIDQVRAHLPGRPQDTLPNLNDIFHFLATTPENNRPLLPGTYQVNENVELILDACVIVRRDRYNRIKLDIFSRHAPVGASFKAGVYDVITVNCVDLNSKNFYVKPNMKNVAKEISKRFDDKPHILDKYSESYDAKDDPSIITMLMTTEVNNMREIGFNKAKGPYFKAFTGKDARIHGFFTMKRIPGSDLFDRIANNEFNSFEKIFEVMLRCLHAADKQVFQHGKLHLDIKPENFICTDYQTNPVRTRVRLIDCETLHDCKATRTTRMIGTRGYSAPELMNHWQIHPTADVYALGMTTRALCNETYARKFLGAEETPELLAQLDRELKTYGCIRIKYLNTANLSADVLQGLTDWHYHATQADPKNRYTNDRCIKSYEEFYIKFRLSLYQEPEAQAKRIAVETGLRHGFQFAQFCRESSVKKLDLQIGGVLAFTIELIKMVNALEASNGDIAEFIMVTDDVILFNCQSYQQLADQINCIYDELDYALRRWNALGQELAQLPNYREYQPEYDLFYETIKNTPLTLDDLDNLTLHILEKEFKMRSSLTPTPTSTPQHNVDDTEKAGDKRATLTTTTDNETTSPVKRQKM